MEKNDDDDFGSHILISAASIRTIRGWLLGACFAIIVGLVGFIVERYYTGGDHKVMAQRTETNRQSIHGLSERTNTLENNCRSNRDNLEIHTEKECHDKMHRPSDRWSRSRQ